MTHDYKRNGTTTLFAALNVLDGKVIGQCQQRHRHQEWLKFLRKIDRRDPSDKTLHLIARQLRHPQASQGAAWLAQHPRFHIHFTPTSRFVAQPGRALLRQADQAPLVVPPRFDSQAAINRFLAETNAKPKPFT